MGAARVERIGGDRDGAARWRGKPVHPPFTAPDDEEACCSGGAAAAVIMRELLNWRLPVIDAPVLFAAISGVAAALPAARDPRPTAAPSSSGCKPRSSACGLDTRAIKRLRAVAPARRRPRLRLPCPRAPWQPGTIGFHERFSHHFVDLPECPVRKAPLLALARVPRDLAAPFQASAHNRAHQREEVEERQGGVEELRSFAVWAG